MQEIVFLAQNNYFKMSRPILVRTFLLTIGASIIGMVLWDWKVFIGIWWGSFMGLIGYRMICSMVRNLTVEDGKSQGMKSYAFRYMFYMIGMLGLVFLHIPVLAGLVGLMAHKAAILLSTIERKDFHGRTG